MQRLFKKQSVVHPPSSRLVLLYVILILPKKQFISYQLPVARQLLAKMGSSRARGDGRWLRGFRTRLKYDL